MLCRKSITICIFTICRSAVHLWVVLETLFHCCLLTFFCQSCFALIYCSPAFFWQYTSGVSFWVQFVVGESHLQRHSVDSRTLGGFNLEAQGQGGAMVIIHVWRHLLLALKRKIPGFLSFKCKGDSRTTVQQQKCTQGLRQSGQGKVQCHVMVVEGLPEMEE